MFFSLCPSLLVKIFLYLSPGSKDTSSAKFSPSSLLFSSCSRSYRLDLCLGTYPILLCCSHCVYLRFTHLLSFGQAPDYFLFDSLHHPRKAFCTGRQEQRKPWPPPPHLALCRYCCQGCHKSLIVEILLFCRQRIQSTGWEGVICGRVSSEVISL